MLRDGLLQSANVEKKRIDVEDHKFKYFQLHKWHILKHIKEDMKLRALEKKRQRIRTTTWAKYSLTYLIMKRIYEEFISHREAVYLL